MLIELFWGFLYFLFQMLILSPLIEYVI